jgi:hypothetical protein
VQLALAGGVERWVVHLKTRAAHQSCARSRTFGLRCHGKHGLISPTAACGGAAATTAWVEHFHVTHSRHCRRCLCRGQRGCNGVCGLRGGSRGCGLRDSNRDCGLRGGNRGDSGGNGRRSFCRQTKTRVPIRGSVSWCASTSSDPNAVVVPVAVETTCSALCVCVVCVCVWVCV